MGTLCLILPLALAQAAAPAEATVKLRSGTAFQVRPAGPGPFPAVVLLHGDFGLNAWVKQQARRLAGKGYFVLALDFYRGELPKTVEEAHILERGLPEDRVVADIDAALAHLAALPEVRK